MTASVNAGVNYWQGRLWAGGGLKLKNVPLPGHWGLLGRDTTASGDVSANLYGQDAGQVEAGGTLQAGPAVLSGRSRFRVQDVWQGIVSGVQRLMKNAER